MKKILIVRLSSFGDILLATPVAEALRENYPSAEISWITESRFTDLLHNNPHLDRVIGYDKQGVDSGLSGMRRLGRRLKAEAFDLIVDLQHKLRSVALARLAKGKRILSFRKRSARDFFAEFLLRLPPRPDSHAVDRYLGALSLFGIKGEGNSYGLTYSIPETAVLQVERLLSEKALDRGRRMVALCPGAAHGTKRWPQEQFAKLAQLLSDEGRLPVILGGPPDRAIIDTIGTGKGQSCLSLVGEIPVMAAALARCEVAVCCDSGPLHLASAVGTKVVGIYGPTSPIRWGPWGVEHRIVKRKLPCAPCSNHGGPKCPKGHHACMQDISVQEIALAMKALFSER